MVGVKPGGRITLRGPPAPRSTSATGGHPPIARRPPEIQPDVTRVSLFGGVCPCCAKRFKAEPPAGLEPGSPFGPNLRAFVVYLRSVQGIPLARLSHVLRDLFGLEISEGALVNILSASRKPFAAQTSLIKARLMAGTALASDETGMRVGKANWWLWVFHHRDSAVFVADKHRSKAVVEAFLGDWRPDYWISDRYGGQMGWAKREHQVCLAHLIRDIQYAIDAGDAVFAPGLKGLLKRACAIGRRRDALADSTLKIYEADLSRAAIRGDSGVLWSVSHWRLPIGARSARADHGQGWSVRPQCRVGQTAARSTPQPCPGSLLNATASRAPGRNSWRHIRSFCRRTGRLICDVAATFSGEATSKPTSKGNCVHRRPRNRRHASPRRRHGRPWLRLGRLAF